MKVLQTASTYHVEFSTEVLVPAPVKSTLTSTENEISCMASKWTPPPPGFIKFNCDGAFHSSTHRGATAIIARDWNGVVVCHQLILFLGVDALTIEGQAVYHALLTARRMSFDNIIVEMDCVVLHSSILSKTFDSHWHITAVLHDILHSTQSPNTLVGEPPQEHPTPSSSSSVVVVASIRAPNHDFPHFLSGNQKSISKLQKTRVPNSWLPTTFRKISTITVACLISLVIGVEQSRWKALVDLEQMQTVHLVKLSDVQCQLESQLKFITEAWLQIVECRQILKWTYAYGYYLPEHEHDSSLSACNVCRFLKLEAKVFYQIAFFQLQTLCTGEVESSLERLHRCAEELETYLNLEHQLAKEFNEFLTKLAGLTSEPVEIGIQDAWLVYLSIFKPFSVVIAAVIGAIFFGVYGSIKSFLHLEVDAKLRFHKENMTLEYVLNNCASQCPPALHILEDVLDRDVINAGPLDTFRTKFEVVLE
ncbi:hypothetical protein FNV43_RR21639 [Rhamnella rubrinervis]|uniref:RNase H type-1 domain-containing protein n=1 Tax=Rhamnella rubrinervis TaxID=2594499 RepID=A0A8K0DUZ5_9ROSA|nr:hypothetical protein FNV43_RR21639 [Rhamnella rubrinervis]